jgi:hypothetical protein
VNHQSKVLVVEMDDLQEVCVRPISACHSTVAQKAPALHDLVMRNTRRYMERFAEAAEALQVEPTEDVCGLCRISCPHTLQVRDESVLDMFIRHRLILAGNAGNGMSSPFNAVHPDDERSRGC